MTKTIAIARANTDILQILAAGILGLSLVFVAGFAGATALHDASHDQRHSIAFPCH